LSAREQQEPGLGHFEGRGWRGFHRHAAWCIASCGFLVSERSRFFLFPAPAILGYALPRRPERHHPHSITTLATVIARYLLGLLPRCPFCGSRSG
jgi:hypothetical protein